ncbi:MAG: hypothetical protein C0466_13080 [Candidatus Accumulibacter sp.]|nr:hypothetical protein [Accumulibacter sp.]
MATVRELQSGRWQAIVRRKGRPAESKTFRTKTEAQIWSQGIEADIERGVFQSTSEAERTTFADIVKRFKEEFAPHQYRKRDDEKEAWRFQLDRLNEFFGPYSLAAIDQKLVASYRDNRIKPPVSSKRKGVGESTVRKELYMLSKVFGFCEIECDIALPRGNPVKRVRKPTDGKARDRRITPTEWAALERECKKSRNPWLAPALELAVETAMRQGELLNLEWKDIDRQHRLALLLDTDKIKNEEARSVPLSSRALKVIDSLPRSTDKVFPVERLTLYHAFVAACKRANITDYTWHDLRHECLSRLAERGDLSMLDLAAISGHKTLQMLKRYTHLQAENLAKKLG